MGVTLGFPLFIGFDPEQKLFSKPRTFAEVQSYLYEQFLQPLDTDIHSEVKSTLEEIQSCYRESFSAFQDKCAKAQEGYPSYSLTPPYSTTWCCESIGYCDEMSLSFSESLSSILESLSGK